MSAPASITVGPSKLGLSGPARLLRLEGLAIAVAAGATYHQLGAGWWLFAALILVPDVGLLGYLAGPGVGARTYNATHTLAAPLALAGVGIALDAVAAVAVALTWMTHIGVDRAAGFGLKYPTSWRETHLQRVAQLEPAGATPTPRDDRDPRTHPQTRDGERSASPQPLR